MWDTACRAGVGHSAQRSLENKERALKGAVLPQRAGTSALYGGQGPQRGNEDSKPGGIF